MRSVLERLTALKACRFCAAAQLVPKPVRVPLGARPVRAPPPQSLLQKGALWNGSIPTHVGSTSQRRASRDESLPPGQPNSVRLKGLYLRWLGSARLLPHPCLERDSSVVFSGRAPPSQLRVPSLCSLNGVYLRAPRSGASGASR
jgi:hypothetical protein